MPERNGTAVRTSLTGLTIWLASPKQLACNWPWQLALATRLGIGASHRKPWTWHRLRLYGLRSLNSLWRLRVRLLRSPPTSSPSLPGNRQQATGNDELCPVVLVAAAPGSTSTSGNQTRGTLKAIANHCRLFVLTHSLSLTSRSRVCGRLSLKVSLFAYYLVPDDPSAAVSREV